MIISLRISLCTCCLETVNHITEGLREWFWLGSQTQISRAITGIVSPAIDSGNVEYHVETVGDYTKDTGEYVSTPSSINKVCLDGIRDA